MKLPHMGADTEMYIHYGKSLGSPVRVAAYSKVRLVGVLNPSRGPRPAKLGMLSSDARALTGALSLNGNCSMPTCMESMTFSFDACTMEGIGNIKIKSGNNHMEDEHDMLHTWSSSCCAVRRLLGSVESMPCTSC